MDFDHSFVMLTCALKKPDIKWFISCVYLTTLLGYDKIELYCKWCSHIHEYTLTTEGLKVKTW